MPKPYKIQWITLVALLSWFAGTEAQQAGHRIADSQIIVNSPRHWKNWVFAPGTIGISPTGEVRPNELHKNTNTTTQIVKFLRFHPPDDLAKKEPEELTLFDAIEAGSNLADVVNVLDGDPATYWEPEALKGAADVRGQWWFGLDLGRLIFAYKIVLRFVEEGQGDPFLLFDVLVSEGLKPSRLQGGDALAFKTVLRTVQPNKSQRVFEIDLRNANHEVQGEPLRFVQVVVTGTDSTQGREVSLAEYEQLDEADRGTIRFFKRQPDGRETVVTEAVHQQLDAERRGAVRYFRRERPRLAELEVWHEGDEIISGIVTTLPGQVTSFTYKLRPTIDSEDLGFDSIGIDTPTKARSVDQVRISGAPVDFEVVEMGSTGFVVQIPRIDIQLTTELIEVDFQAEVFKFGTVFSGRASSRWKCRRASRRAIPTNWQTAIG